MELAVASVVMSTLSGVTAYLGAQTQADAMEQQGDQAVLMGDYNATVARNNAQAQAQDLEFQSGVNAQNISRNNQERTRALQQQSDKTRMLVAKQEATAGKQGALDYSFDDVLRSSALLAEREEADILAGTAEQSYNLSTQSRINTEMGDRAIETGRVSANLASLEGTNRATSLRNRASDTRFAGIGNAVSSFGQAAGTASTINFGGSWNPSKWTV